jgi:hypothetical protein
MEELEVRLKLDFQKTLVFQAKKDTHLNSAIKDLLKLPGVEVVNIRLAY